MKSLIYILLFSIVLVAACGEDRSGEQPFAPTVQTGTAAQTGDSVLLTGAVLNSPNSSLRECGFEYGNDTLRGKVVADTANTFSAYTDSLGKGTYYAVAYARNGVGTGHGDTIYFVVR
jgi:hypothetical protein